ncbi:zinc ABC transporter substrate-binding protein [Paracoccus sp. 1_MG-2023]|uniref:zinc ABC transporter substrate-binding protein n=1 Tax=unclassified Paracoccus (in: a-proteobacteria) TaxID=2688777 RepID=UPI00209196FA|nr:MULTISPECIES: zinc ABC transporter substrate-binding protein [unclassified Paracoccus (in: a-proteobacteria)]MDO6669337.1 zinc ABC transporter substrate-binding protein [Paracoccus sp. 1_MG-2023]
MRLTLTAILSLTALPALADPGRIMVDLPPTGALVREVVGDLAQVEVLLSSGASAHSYQMRPSDARNLQDAALLVWMGPEMTAWLERPAQNIAAEAVQLQLLHVDGTRLRDYADGDGHEDHEDHEDHGGHDHDHDHDHDHNDHNDHHDHDDHGHGEHESAGHEGHDHSGIDPHAWLDPANAGPWLNAIADALSQIDPENAETYSANAEAASGRIEASAAELKARLAPHAEKGFVVFHDAYGYFTDAFGLMPATSVAIGDATSPSAARLEEVRHRIEESDAVCAFPEYAHDPRLVETVIEGSGIRMGDALSPEGGSEEMPGYEQILASLGTALIDCFEAE